MRQIYLFKFYTILLFHKKSPLQIERALGNFQCLDVEEFTPNQKDQDNLLLFNARFHQGSWTSSW